MAEYPWKRSDSRVSAKAAGYMELSGAEKNADCHKVKVSGGVATEKGCCNLFEPKPKASQFRCGMCQHVRIQ